MKKKKNLRFEPATLLENTRIPGKSGKPGKPKVHYDPELADTWAYGYSIPEKLGGKPGSNPQDEVKTLVIQELRKARGEKPDENPRHNVLHLDSLAVCKKAPAGTGSDIMRQLCEFADSEDIILTLSLAGKADFKNQPKYKRTTSTRRLEKFYRRFGFKKNTVKGRFDLKGSMHREPKTKTL